MNQSPKVSVHILTYNHEMFIRETLDSVIAQEYDNLEIVVADDASTDHTPLILREYAMKYPQLLKVIINEKNMGITPNCNIALEACSGEFVAFLGGDDVMLPGKIAKQVELFVNTPDVVLSYHSVDVFESDTGKTQFITYLNSRENIQNAYDLIRFGGILGACSVMVKKEACPLGGFNESVPVVSDWLLYIETAFNGTVKRLDGVYCRYRKHKNSTSLRTYELLEETIRCLDIVVEKYREKKGIEEICRKGKARYLAGEAFRQLTVDICVAEKLIREAVLLDPQNLKLKLLYYFTTIKPLARCCGKTINRYKYKLKKFI